jgi:putative phosphoribosyl transferase
MLESLADSDALLLAIPAGGVPVAAAIAKQLKLALDVAVVSKITLPWNTEAGYGAVGFDGTVRLNDELLSRLRLTDREIHEGIARTRCKVASRLAVLRGSGGPPDHVA